MKKVIDKETVKRCARDQEYRVRMLSGDIARESRGIEESEKEAMIGEVIGWIKEGMGRAEVVVEEAKDQVEAFRRVSEVERYLESDFQFVKGLMESVEGNQILKDKVWVKIEDLMKIIEERIC